MASLMRARASSSVAGGLAWTTLVGAIDALLRRCHGVHEYCDDPDCIFRVSLETAAAPARLSDGTTVAVGDPVAELHFWNEHLPPFPAGGPDLHWAKRAQRQVRHSLAALCRHVEAGGPDWQRVRAIRAVAPISRDGNAVWQMHHLAHRHGFDVLPSPAAAVTRLPAVTQSVLTWAFARAYNPGALRHYHFLRRQQEIWLSRATLCTRYGSADRDAAPTFREAAE